MIEHVVAWQMIHLSPHWSMASDESYSALNSISPQSYTPHWAFSYLKRIFSAYYFSTLPSISNYCIAEIVCDLLEVENLVWAVYYIDLKAATRDPLQLMHSDCMRSAIQMIWPNSLPVRTPLGPHHHSVSLEFRFRWECHE